MPRSTPKRAARRAKRVKYSPLDCESLWGWQSDDVASAVDWEKLQKAFDDLTAPVLKTLLAEVRSTESSSDGTPAVPAAAVVPEAVRQVDLRSPECREEIAGADEGEWSPVKQYSRAYLYHLHEVHELLGTMLLAQHNLHVYLKFFEALRRHIKEDSLQRFAAWFLRTQTCEAPEPKVQSSPKKRQKI
eukprot:g33638.t1